LQQINSPGWQYPCRIRVIPTGFASTAYQE
jgi:hypothetical protein